MIRYSLKCENDHVFESWFQSAEAFDKLKAAGMAVCVDCGSGKVDKTLMAPRVRPARNTSASPERPGPDLTTPNTDKEKALSKLRKEIEANSEYVGMNFASEARAMHDGDAPPRAIYGEAKPEEAKSLIEDGVPVAPLPFTPKAKTN